MRRRKKRKEKKKRKRKRRGGVGGEERRKRMGRWGSRGEGQERKREGKKEKKIQILFKQNLILGFTLPLLEGGSRQEEAYSAEVVRPLHVCLLHVSTDVHVTRMHVHTSDQKTLHPCVKFIL